MAPRTTTASRNIFEYILYRLEMNQGPTDKAASSARVALERGGKGRSKINVFSEAGNGDEGDESEMTAVAIGKEIETSPFRLAMFLLTAASAFSFDEVPSIIKQKGE